MKRLAFILAGLLVGGSVIAQQPRSFDPFAPEPSKVWGYIAAKSPQGNLFLPGVIQHQPPEVENQTSDLWPVVLTKLTVVFREEGGVEHRVEFGGDQETGRVRQPYYLGSGDARFYPGLEETSNAIRYEVRFAHARKQTFNYDPVLITPNGPTITNWGVVEDPDTYTFTETNVYDPRLPTQYPIIMYDPSKWRFDRVEVEKLRWERHLNEQGSLKETKFLVLQPDTSPLQDPTLHPNPDVNTSDHADPAAQ